MEQFDREPAVEAVEDRRVPIVIGYPKIRIPSVVPTPDLDQEIIGVPTVADQIVEEGGTDGVTVIFVPRDTEILIDKSAKDEISREEE